MRYKRILLKLSGGAVSGDREFGFDPAALEYIADEILTLHDAGIQVGMVIGGGNIFRGSLGAKWGIDRSEADNIGMLGTIQNALMLRGVLNAKRPEVEVRVMTAIPIDSVAEPLGLLSKRFARKLVCPTCTRICSVMLSLLTWPTRSICGSYKNLWATSQSPALCNTLPNHPTISRKLSGSFTHEDELWLEGKNHR